MEYEPSVWYNGEYSDAYKDPHVLRGMHERGMLQKEIANVIDVHPSTVRKYMNKFDIINSQKRPWRDEEVMERLYIDEKLSQREIAYKLNTGQDIIFNWIHKHEIETRSPSESRKLASMYDPVPFITSIYDGHRGYEKWHHSYEGEKNQLLHHRLLAVAEYGFGTVVDNSIHHKNNIPWDNRVENIEIMDEMDHQQLHGIEKSGGDGQWYDENLMREFLVDRGMTHKEISNEWGCSAATISRWRNRHGIEVNNG